MRAASSAARSGESTSTTPPPLPRPPTWTCTLTTDRPPSSRVAAAASSPAWWRRSRAASRSRCARNSVLALVLVQIHAALSRSQFGAWRSRRSRSQPAMSPVLAPGVKIFSMPAASSFGMSSAGMMPPPKTRMSPAPRSRSCCHDLAGTASCARPNGRRARPRRRPPGSRSRRSARGSGAGRVDHLEPRVAQGARHHLGPAVVPVEARLRDDDAIRAGHARAV